MQAVIKVCFALYPNYRQINSCYEFSLPIAASVLLRRFVGDIVDSCFGAKIADRIKRDGNYYKMLGDIIKVAINDVILSLARGTKDLLNDHRTIWGYVHDHARRFAAVQADLDKIHNSVRGAIDRYSCICQE